MKILSLFDGMACGYIAFKNLGIEIDEYHAYEIDKYATKTATHNFPDIKEHGDVFAEDFSKYSGSVDWLIGGSPCTYWSIAQTKNRETVASGMGWELFSQYVRALHEAKPKYFLYENNKSMSQAIRESICETFGFEPVLINSALVSAQNRQRLYWVGIRQEDGTYKKAEIAQPEDRGILLKHVLDTNRTTWLDKAHTIDATYYKATEGTVPFNGHQSSSRMMVAEEINPLSEGEMDYMVRDSKGNYSDRWAFLNKPEESDKSVCITANVSKGVPYNIVAEPVCVRQIGRNPENPKSRVAGLPTEQMYEARFDKKTNTLTTVQKDNMVAEPVCLRYERTEEGKALRKQYEAHEIEHGYREHQVLQPRTDGKTNTLSTVLKDKSNCLQTSCSFYQYCGTVKAPIYEVKDGMIEVKGKKYPIKLVDGYYIIRKLTVTECMRLQTVPEWYEWPVSNSQAYKMLGNGWTVEVIMHLIKEATK